MTAFNLLAFDGSAFDSSVIVAPQSKFLFLPDIFCIVVQPGYTEFTATELYFAWKVWAADNLNYPQAFRTVGGDPISGLISVSSYFFLMNGWRVRPYEANHTLVIDGNLFVDGGGDPVVRTLGDFNVLVKTVVPMQAQSISTSGANVVQIRQEMDNNSTKLAQIKAILDSMDTPTAVEIRQEIDSNSTQLSAIKARTDTIASSPTTGQIADAVRTELSPELARIMTLENNPSLTTTQATMLLEMYDLLGLDPIKPLVVTRTARTAGSISQLIQTDDNSTTVTRV